jgi:hypothetical protein
VKRRLFFAAALLPLLWFCLPAALPAEPSLTIAPPVGDVLAGDDIDLRVTGLAIADFSAQKVAFIPPESADAKCRLIAQWGLAGLEPTVTFRARKAGQYRVVLVKALPGEKLLTAACVVTVKGGPSPDPQPEPGPDPKPTPTKLTAVAIVAETAGYGKLPLPQRQLLASVAWPKAVAAKSLKYRRIDPNDSLPPEWQAAVKAAGALPALVFLDASGVGESISLPADEATAVAELNRRAKP